MKGLIETPLHRRFAAGTVWSLAGTVVSQLTVLGTLLIVARWMIREEYGRLVVLQSTLGAVGVFAGFGIGVTATRYIAAWRESDKDRLSKLLGLCQLTLLGFGLAASLALAMFAETFAISVLNSEYLAAPLRIAAFGILFSSLDGYQKSALIGFEDLKAFAKCSAIGALGGSVVILIGVRLGGLEGAAWGLLASAMIQAFASRYQLRKAMLKYSVLPRFRGIHEERRIIVTFALPSLFGGIVVMPTHWLAQVMLANSDGGHAKVALLGIVMQWHTAVLFLPSVVGRVVLPIMTEYANHRSSNEAGRLLQLALKANALVAIPLAGLLSLFSPLIIGMYGSSYQDGAAALGLSVLAAALAAIAWPAGNLMAAQSKMWVGFVMNVGWAAVFLVSARLAINLGALGVVMALVFAHVCNVIWVYWWVRRQLRMV